MIDRRNRTALTLFGLLLLIGGGLSAAVGAGAFGSNRSNRNVFDPTVVRWWNEGGWKSFAVVTAIGVILLSIGFWLVLGQLRRNDGRPHTSMVTFPADGTRGETTLRTSALSNGLEADLEQLADVDKANVHLFGKYPEIKMRAVLTIVDAADLDNLPTRVDEVLARVETTAGVRPDPIQVTLRFKAADQPRLVE